MYEVPFRSPQGLLVPRPYNPHSIGAAAPAGCPTRSLWWLALAFGVGAYAGHKYYSKRRRAR